ncbi:MAG: hypothetical protein RLZ98_3233 [Pseudomonadota bacterium]|jgi:signal transduction histidine kinase
MTARSMAAKATLAAAEFLSDRGLFGLVWFGDDLIITSRTGVIADLAPPGEIVTECVLPLFGLEDNIRALKHGAGKRVHVPNVSIVTSADERLRLDIHVYWLPARKEFLLLLARAPAHHTIEMQLYEESRRRRLAEEKNLEQAEELARANRDLSEFAYVISHDLNAPLRALRYHVEDLEPHLSGNQEARRILELITFQSRRMSAMLSDLLAYSRIDRKTETKAAVDTSALVQTIVRSLPRPSGMEMEIAGDWPTVETYAAPLDLVLRNLLHNAIKHHDRDGGLIVARCRWQETGLDIEITDDGPGIPPCYHEAIFQPFCKLDITDDGSMLDENAEASGIGLALVRRTAETVGANIELISDPDTRRGTTFRVHWPAGSPATVHCDN